MSTLSNIQEALVILRYDSRTEKFEIILLEEKQMQMNSITLFVV